MKKLLAVLFVFVFAAVSAVAPAGARPGKVILKGQVEAVNLEQGTVLLTTTLGIQETVVLPAGFYATLLAAGDWLLVKGVRQADGSLLAEVVKVVELKDEGEDDDPDDKQAGAFCAGGGQTFPHPVATKISAQYGVSVEWVMQYFCGGYGMGQIMLALKTGPAAGLEPEAMLAMRAEGKGWGEIWQEAKLIGPDKDKTPPGLNKNEEGAPKPGKGPKKDK
jgi:hypothetical protein